MATPALVGRAPHGLSLFLRVDARRGVPCANPGRTRYHRLRASARLPRCRSNKESRVLLRRIFTASDCAVAAAEIFGAQQCAPLLDIDVPVDAG
jgi:hypothetical protein